MKAWLLPEFTVTEPLGAIEPLDPAEAEIVYVTLGIFTGKVTVTTADLDTETFPDPSFAQAYRVFVPADANVYVVGAADNQPAAPEDGVVAPV